MTTIRNRHGRTARTRSAVAPSSLHRARARRVPETTASRAARPQRRATVRRIAPLTKRGARPLLRLVVSNPDRPGGTPNAPRRGHLSLVGADATLPGALQTVGQPWAEAASRSHLLIVLGLAAAGLVALASSIGRLLST